MAVGAAEGELIAKSLKRWAGWDRIPEDVMTELCRSAELMEVKRKRSVFEPAHGRAWKDAMEERSP